MPISSTITLRVCYNLSTYTRYVIPQALFINRNTGPRSHRVSLCTCNGVTGKHYCNGLLFITQYGIFNIRLRGTTRLTKLFTKNANVTKNKYTRNNLWAIS